MEILISEELNNLRVSVDWIALTCEDAITPESLIQDLGFATSEFEKLERGANGYRKQLKHSLHSVRVLYDGSADMGIHLIVSGSAVSFVLQSFIENEKKLENKTPFDSTGRCVSDFNESDMTRLLNHLSQLGKFTRLDIAIDDLKNVGLSPDEASSLVKNGQCVSRFRTCRHTEETDYQGNRKGQTVYFGSGQSDFLVRLYDKKLEQESKGKVVDSPSWYRWELELKKEYADRTVKSVIAGTPVSSLAIGILSYYIRFINLDNSVRSRCSMFDKWANFVKDVLGSRLYVAPPEKKIQHKRDWINRQVAPSLAAVFVASGSDVNVLYDIISNGWERVKKPLKAAVDDELNTIQLSPYTEFLMDCYRMEQIFELQPLQMEIAKSFEEEMFSGKPYYKNGELLPLPVNSFKRNKRRIRVNDFGTTC